MPKYKNLNEGLIDSFIGAIFGSVAKQVKSKALKDLSTKDPKLAKQIKDLEKRRKDMETYIKKNKAMLKKRYPDSF